MTPRRLKHASILAGIALSALTLLAWTQRWYVITLETGQSLAVDGDVAAPALTALALSGLALAAALAIAGRFFRFVLGLLQASLGALISAAAAIAIADPVVASERAITDETGVAGRESIANLVSVVAASLWPYATLALGILLTVLGLAIVASSRRWPESSRKYSATTLENEAGERSAVGDWDALSDGRDPSV